MKASEFVRKIMSGYLWANLAAMALVVILLCLGVKFGIDLYTHHGEEIAVPNVRHKVFSDASSVLEDVGLKVMVKDTGYVKTLPPDCILEQTPAPGEKVKSGRIVYVTINSPHTPTLTLPDVIDKVYPEEMEGIEEGKVDEFEEVKTPPAAEPPATPSTPERK